MSGIGEGTFFKCVQIVVIVSVCLERQQFDNIWGGGGKHTVDFIFIYVLGFVEVSCHKSCGHNCS
jgi:hypothetical protein